MIARFGWQYNCYDIQWQYDADTHKITVRQPIPISGAAFGITTYVSVLVMTMTENLLFNLMCGQIVVCILQGIPGTATAGSRGGTVAVASPDSVHTCCHPSPVAPVAPRRRRPLPRISRLGRAASASSAQERADFASAFGRRGRELRRPAAAILRSGG